MTQTGGNLIMNNDVSFGAAQTWAVTNTKAITVNGILSGASGNTLTKSDLGTLMLAGANTYSGGTILDAGTPRLLERVSLQSTAVRLATQAARYRISITMRKTGTATLLLTENTT